MASTTSIRPVVATAVSESETARHWPAVLGAEDDRHSRPSRRRCRDRARGGQLLDHPGPVTRMRLRADGGFRTAAPTTIMRRVLARLEVGPAQSTARECHNY